VALSALITIEPERKAWLRAEVLLRLIREDTRYKEASRMILTTYDRGMAAGEAKGKREALQVMVIRLASRQCGAPEESTRAKILAIEEVARLENLVETATTAQSWDELLATK
jgi:hypothetical protein